MDLSMVSFLDEVTVASRDPKAPTVGAFLSVSENPARVASIVDLVNSGIMVLPVVKDLARFTSFVFDELRGINGIELSEDDSELERVAAVLLEGLSLLRRSRRLFISYRRTETQGVAIQLYEALDQHGFDVFLDTVSIRPGEQFQDVLWHRLADTDVIVLLDSPGFLASRWTTAELARANSTSIQTLQLVWPHNRVEATAAFSKAVMLTEDDFETSHSLGADARLDSTMVETLITEVESLRARALAARHTYLVQEFCADAARLGLTAHVQPDRFLTVQPKSGTFVAVVPTVGIPDSVRYQEVEDIVSRHPLKHSEVILLYDERGVQRKWLEHLKWLDRHKLSVQSVQVADSVAWLGSRI